MSSTLSRRALLGAALPPDGEAFTADGMRIDDVFDGGIAARAGLVAGDVVTSLADRPVRDLCELAEALRAAGREPTTEVVTQRGRAVVEVVHQPCDPKITYGELAVDGARLRTLTMHAPTRARAVIAMIQGIACESVEPEPFASLAQTWSAAGYTTVRFDKRGVGDSQGGPCRSTDFHTELADAAAMVTHARSLGLPLVLFGHSVGGIIAPQLARDCAAVIVYGTPVMPWLECLNDSIRRQLELRGAPAEIIAEELAKLARLAEVGELNGRSAAYHAQLAAIDIAAAWRTVEAPVLVARGEHDWVVRADDQARIAELARGPTTIVDLAGLDHLAGWHPDRAASLRDYGVGEANDQLAQAALAWLGSISK